MLRSIFNDVIGPVMRGPSSSHCAAALRIGRLARDLMGGELSEVLVQFDRHGALATTHETQGSDMGLWAGLLSWEPEDERLPDSLRLLQQAGVSVRIELADLHDPHPNTYRLRLRGPAGEHSLRAVSNGGGMIELIDVDGFEVSIAGDYFETLIRTAGDGAAIADRIKSEFDADQLLVHRQCGRELVEVKAQRPLDDGLLERLQAEYRIDAVQRLNPVLPVLSRKDVRVPFRTCKQMLDYDAGRNRPLWKLAVEYESARGGLSKQDVLARMDKLVAIMRCSIERGVAGTQYADRILGAQAPQFLQAMGAGRLIAAGALNRAILYVSAIMEEKSSLGVIVAAPTAGASAVLPGACFAVADEAGLDEAALLRAMLAAGLVGVFIAERSTFAAEVAGCQAECGSASAMAAAALVELAGGEARQALAAASIALQNSLGMICDPVASRVEVPCLGKNVMAAANALACANMALAGYDPLIPLDEVLEAADAVGRSLPRQLRCTALGGLATTPTAIQLQRDLNRRQGQA